MKLQVRWILFEALKFALVLALFVWFQGRLVDSRQEVYASTSKIVQAQGVQGDRLHVLERTRADASESLRATSYAVEQVRSEIQREIDEQELAAQQLKRLLDDRSGELRGLIERGISRVEGTSHTAVAHTQSVQEQISHLEKRLRRSSSELKELMLYPVAQLRGNGTVGSGVVIASLARDKGSKYDTYVVTAYHVVVEIMEGVPGADQIDDLRFLDPATDQLELIPREAKLLATHQEADLALIRVTTPYEYPYVANLASDIEMDSTNVFDAVYAVGCPLGNKPLPTVGEVSSQKKLVGGQNFWMVNAPTFFGNSGGGVFLSESGKLIGISSMIYTYGKKQPMVVPHMGLFVPLPTVREWLGDEGFAHLLDGAIAVEKASHTIDEFPLPKSSDETPRSKE